MFSAKDNDDSFVRKHTHHATGGGGAGGERSELHHSHGRKQTHQTTREEGDLICQTCRSCHKVAVTYQNASNCGTYTNTIPLVGGEGGLARTAPYICTRMSWKSSEHSLMCPL